MSKTKVEIHKPDDVEAMATLVILKRRTASGSSILTIATHGTGLPADLVGAVTATIEKSLRENPEYEFPKG